MPPRARKPTDGEGHDMATPAALAIMSEEVGCAKPAGIRDFSFFYGRGGGRLRGLNTLFRLKVFMAVCRGAALEPDCAHWASRNLAVKEERL